MRKRGQAVKSMRPKLDPARGVTREPEVPEVRAGRRDSGDAFMLDPEKGPAHIEDDLAESLAEEFVRSATTGEDTGDETHDQFVSEEIGGPFVETTGDEEFALDADPSNTKQEPQTGGKGRK